ncbi:hypothetical protein HK104_004831, partial [Borealophlyctis nickersoniae]
DERLVWSNPAEVYPRMMHALSIPTFRANVLVGLVVSVGGLTESLVRHSSTSLITYLSTLPSTPDLTHPPPSSSTPESTVLPTLTDFFTTLLDVFSAHLRNDRVTVPLLDVIDLLFGCDAVDRVKDSERGDEVLGRLYELCRAEVERSKDVKKVGCAVKVFCGFASLETQSEIKKKSLRKVVMYLAHPYPRIRRAAAEGLYMVVTTTLDEVEEVEQLLLETDWYETGIVFAFVVRVGFNLFWNE